MAQGDYNHVEIPADNVDRAVAFYKAVFGWHFQSIPGFEGYELYTTAAGQSGVGGGIGKRGQTAGKEIRNYVSVNSVDDAVKKITQHGGHVVLPKAEVMGQGWYAVVKDTEGNEFAVWQQDPNAPRG
jgi:predicted enzyme related to lactoylglutathione lyase